ncbi:MAG: FAD-binding protein [Candidatus Omnitrophota bacterium]
MMHLILLAKQVPDVSNIPADAWDHEKGVLRRSALVTVPNPMDLQALAFALQIKAMIPGTRIIALSMGPSQACAMLEDLMARGADEAVLLSDMAFAGADTPATAYALSMAIRRVVREKCQGAAHVIIAGVQSPDGDTAQVPPQVAEELGMEHVAYVQGVEVDVDGRLGLRCVGTESHLKVVPRQYPFLVSVAKGFALPPRSFHRRRVAVVSGAWDAASVGALPGRVGFKGSRTWVSGIEQVSPSGQGVCSWHQDVETLVEAMARAYATQSTRVAAPSGGYELGARTASYQGDVWVYVQQDRGVLAPVSLEVLAKARELAMILKVKVGAVLVVEKAGHLIDQVFEAGADKIYLAEHALLKGSLPAAHKKVIAAMVGQYSPQIMLFGATSWGRVLAPRVAYSLGVGLTADCTAFALGDQGTAVGVLKQIRPALGGNIMATIISKDSFCQMATVRPGVFKSLASMSGFVGELIRCEAVLGASDVMVDVTAGMRDDRPAPFDQIRVIVSGGRGMGSRRAFEKYSSMLAQALSDWLKVKVVVGASRMAVEDGWADHGHQVGQTGTSVAPQLYVAVGISGAIQHLVGISHAACVVAINKDAKAMIFQRADHGVVGDFEVIVPQLVEAIRRRCV